MGGGRTQLVGLAGTGLFPGDGYGRWAAREEIRAPSSAAAVDLEIGKETDLKSLRGDPRFVLLVAHAKESAATVTMQHSD